MLPKIADGQANKLWVIPSEITKALEGLGSAIHEVGGIPLKSEGPKNRVDLGSTEPLEAGGSGALASAEESVQEALREAQASAPVDEPPAAEEPPSPEPPTQ